MDTQFVAVIVVVALAVLGVAAWFFSRRLRTKHLKEQFGPEYDRTVDKVRDPDIAEEQLREREKRVARFNIVPLASEELRHYQERWSSIQGRFVDDPKEAVIAGNVLIQEVMRKRGYPVSDFEQSAADLSVQYPAFVENYRSACKIAERNTHGIADTEELRRALVYYRALFEELLSAGEPQPSEKVAPLKSARMGFRFGKNARSRKRGAHA